MTGYQPGIQVEGQAIGESRSTSANINDGLLGTPMVGDFANGRGEFYNQETCEGRAIFVRFVPSWETNWIANFSR